MYYYRTIKEYEIFFKENNVNVDEEWPKIIERQNLLKRELNKRGFSKIDSDIFVFSSPSMFSDLQIDELDQTILSYKSFLGEIQCIDIKVTPRDLKYFELINKQ